jgi:Mrp family chromosome partitioning ATPase
MSTERPARDAAPLPNDDQSLDAYRLLLHRIREVLASDSPQCIALTSARAGEGKTTTAVNLAFVAAERSRVLVVDANLSRPGAATRLDAPAEPGLTDLLVDGLRPEEAIASIESSGYDLLPAGRRVRHHADLLAGRLMTTLIAELKRHYDLILLDGPPVDDVEAAASLVRAADASFFVVRSGQTCRKVADRALAVLAGAGARIDGCILTAAEDGIECDRTESTAAQSPECNGSSECTDVDVQLYSVESFTGALANADFDIRIVPPAAASPHIVCLWSDHAVVADQSTPMDSTQTAATDDTELPLVTDESVQNESGDIELPAELELVDPKFSLEAISAFDLEPETPAVTACFAELLGEAESASAIDTNGTDDDPGRAVSSGAAAEAESGGVIGDSAVARSSVENSTAIFSEASDVVNKVPAQGSSFVDEVAFEIADELSAEPKTADDPVDPLQYTRRLSASTHEQRPADDGCCADSSDAANQPRVDDAHSSAQPLSRVRLALAGLRIGDVTAPAEPTPVPAPRDRHADGWTANMFAVCGGLLFVVAAAYLAFDVLMCL